jgi:NTE family protein
VLSGGGARGAYEAGVLAHIFEHVYPRLPPGFEFDLVSGTSVGAIHAAYLAASAHLDPTSRAAALAATWAGMTLDHVLRLGPLDIAAVPLRAIGLETLIRGGSGSAPPALLGGLVDVSPLERLVAERVPWAHLRANLDRGRPGGLCISCTEIHTGVVKVFLDGPLTSTEPWRRESHVTAEQTEITPLHVRASAAIPFLFPAVRVEGTYYLDGGLRVNTPLTPVLRQGAERVLVIGLRCEHDPDEPLTVADERAITQPAFLLGKVLNVLLLDQLEHELARLEVINTVIDSASEVFGADCLDHINEAVRVKRGVEYRKVRVGVVRPSTDIGHLCADAYHRQGERSSGLTARLLARLAVQGVPRTEADLLSYVYFDARFTEPMLELGREDARRQEDEILELLGAA